MDLVNSAKVWSQASGILCPFSWQIAKSSNQSNWTHKLCDIMTDHEFADRDGPILVHCSAGVGRTGTYIAVFKLWLDVKDPKVKKLSIKDTMLELRKQRCLMVQKKEQYVYIARCLRWEKFINWRMKKSFCSYIVNSEEGQYIWLISPTLINTKFYETWFRWLWQWFWFVYNLK